MKQQKRIWRLMPDIAALFFILLWMYAATSKLMDYQKFRVQLGQSPMLTSLAGMIAWMIPSAEIAIALLLMADKWRLAGLYASFSLMVMFTGYIIAITRFSEYVPCSCGGILEKLSWNEHLVFNVGCLAVAAAGILLYKTDQLHTPANYIRRQQ